MNSQYGEMVELYTQTAVLQIQRIETTRSNKIVHAVNVTIAPLIETTNGRKADFQLKQCLQLGESGMANLAVGIMGLKQNIEIKGSQKSDLRKVLYVNVNQNGTSSLIISSLDASKSTNSSNRQSIQFQNSERYPLLRVVVTQLAKNSSQYEQSVADTLNLLKASVLMK